MSLSSTTIFQNSLSFISTLEKTLPASLLKNKLLDQAYNLKIHTWQALNQPKEENFSFLGKAAEDLQALEGLLTSENPSLNEKKLLALLTEIKNLYKKFPENRPKIIILTMEMGQGHISAAKATIEGIEALYGLDYDLEIIDLLEFINEFTAETTKTIYYNSVKYFPSIPKFILETFDNKNYVKFFNLLNYPFLHSKIKKIIEEKKPDLIVSTHPLWDYAINKVWKKNKKQSPFISIVTDSISIHAAWATNNSDYYLVPNQETAVSLKKQGILASKIKTLGFPLKLKFFEPIDKKKILTAFDLQPNKFNLLFLPSNHLPFKKNLAITEALISHFPKNQLIIITGEDAKLKNKLAKNLPKSPSLHLFGWTDKLPEIMQISDLVITKAGGVITMECLAAKKPVVFTHILPPQETGNAKLVQKYQVGEIAKTPTAICQAVQKIQTNYSTYQKNIRKIATPKSTLAIARFIIESLFPTTNY